MPREEPISLLEEQIAFRRGLGAYLDLTTEIHRADVARTAEFIAEIRARLEKARRRRLIHAVREPSSTVEARPEVGRVAAR